MTDVADGFFETRGGRFNAAISFQELTRRFPLEMEEFTSVFRVTKDRLEEFWKVFNFNSRLDKFRRLNAFCEERMENVQHAKAVFHFTSLMMTLQIKYLANFRHLNSQQLIEVFTIVVIRLQNFAFVNIMTRPLERLKSSIHEVIVLLRDNHRLGGTDAWLMSSLCLLETLDFQLGREQVRTVDGVLRFFEIITRGVRFENFHSPDGRLENVVCLPSVGEINYQEDAN